MGEKEIADLVKQIPVGRCGRTSEIGEAAPYLASDELAFTIGGELVIDGGMSTL